MRALTFLLLIGLVACQDTPTAPTASLDTPFTLLIGQSATVGSSQLTVRFNRVAAEGRCPLDVLCFWEGEAIIDLDVQRPGVPTVTVPLKILGYVTRENTSAHQPVDTLGFRFTLMQLDPYPKHAGSSTGIAAALVKVSLLPF
jgi:hypothetical protein